MINICAHSPLRRRPSTFHKIVENNGTHKNKTGEKMSRERNLMKKKDKMWPLNTHNCISIWKSKGLNAKVYSMRALYS